MSIADVADQPGLDVDRTTVLADDCERAGWVQHDAPGADGTRAQALPHRVTLAAEGWGPGAAEEEGKR